MGNMVVEKICNVDSLNELEELLRPFSFEEKNEYIKKAIKKIKKDSEKSKDILALLEKAISFKSKFEKREDSCIRTILSSFPYELDLDEYYVLETPIQKIEYLEELDKKYNKYLRQIEADTHDIIVSFISFIKIKENISLSKHNKKAFKEYLEKYPNFLKVYNDFKLKRKKILIGKDSIKTLKEMNQNKCLKKNKTMSFELTKEEEIILNDVGSFFEWIDSFDVSNPNFRGELVFYTNSLNKKLNSLSLEEQNVFATIYLRLLKAKTKKYKNTDKKKYTILRSLKVIVETYLKVDYSKEKDNYYDILLPFLDSNFNYVYVKNMIEMLDGFKTARNDEHILIEIVDKFILSSKLKLADQGFDYVDPEYLYQVFKLFFKDLNPLFDSEKNHVDEMLDSFKEYLLSHKYKYNDLYMQYIESMKDISKNGIKEEIPEFNSKDYTYVIFDFMNRKRVNLTDGYLSSIRSKITDTNISHKEGASNLEVSLADYENALTSTSSFMFENGKYAYSFYYDKDGSIFFRIHTFDIRFLKDEKNVQNVLENNSFKLEAFKRNPTITYQFKLFPNGMLGDLKYFESLVEPSKVYTMDDLKRYRVNDDTKQFISSIKRMDFENEISISEIERFIEEEISSYIVEHFSKTNKTMLYTQKIVSSEEQLLNNHYNICHKLMNLSKSESDLINKILRLPLGIGYSTDVTTTSYVEIDTTYLGFILQSSLFGDLDPLFLEEEADRLNKKIGYVPNYFMKSDKYLKKIN